MAAPGPALGPLWPQPFRSPRVRLTLNVRLSFSPVRTGGHHHVRSVLAGSSIRAELRLGHQQGGRAYSEGRKVVVPTAEPVDAQSFDVVIIGGGPAGYGAALYRSE